MTLTQLRYVLALEEHRSFRAAALACHVSQPALSAQLQKLEDLLGATLFDRSKKPIVPTEVGARIVPLARTIVQETERLADLARCEAELVAGRYRLGILPTLAPSILPRLLPAFCAAHPEVQLSVEEHPTEALLERLAEDRLDGGIAATPLSAPGIHEHVLFREAFLAYLPAGHRLLRKRRVRQDDLRDEPMWLLSEGHCFRSQVLQLCGSHCPVSSTKGAVLDFEGGTLTTLMGLVEQGLGVTVIPDLTLRAHPEELRLLHARPFAAPVPHREVSLLYARRHLRRAIAERLAQCVIDTLPADVRPDPRRSAKEHVVHP